jgi:COMPASS component SWD1
MRTIRFEAPVFNAELHPYNHLQFIAAIFDAPPVVVDVSEDVPIKQPLPTVPKRTQTELENATEKQIAADTKQVTTILAFSTSGNHILAGTTKGWLNIIETSSRQTQYSVRITNAVVTMLRLSSTGREIVVNSGDRIIRTFDLPDLDNPKLNFDQFRIQNEQKYQDIVNRLSWNHVSFSSTGEYVLASILMNHHLYVWEREHGSLEKILEGPNEELSMVEWHPHKPYIAASGMDSGRIYLWSVTYPQKWSALAPDFQEVEENIEYIEREDEFDIHPIEEIHKRMLHQEDEDIDVLTIDPVKKGYEQGDFNMPVVFDVDGSDSEDDIVAVGAGQYRRKSPGQGKEWMHEDDGGVTTSGDESGTPARKHSKKRRRGGSETTGSPR